MPLSDASSRRRPDLDRPLEGSRSGRSDRSRDERRPMKGGRKPTMKGSRGGGKGKGKKGKKAKGKGKGKGKGKKGGKKGSKGGSKKGSSKGKGKKGGGMKGRGREDSRGSTTRGSSRSVGSMGSGSSRYGSYDRGSSFGGDSYRDGSRSSRDGRSSRNSSRRSRSRQRRKSVSSTSSPRGRRDRSRGARKRSTSDTDKKKRRSSKSSNSESSSGSRRVKPRTGPNQAVYGPESEVKIYVASKCKPGASLKLLAALVRDPIGGETKTAYAEHRLFQMEIQARSDEESKVQINDVVASKASLLYGWSTFRKTLAKQWLKTGKVTICTDNNGVYSMLTGTAKKKTDLDWEKPPEVDAKMVSKDENYARSKCSTDVKFYHCAKVADRVLSVLYPDSKR